VALRPFEGQPPAKENEKTTPLPPQKKKKNPPRGSCFLARWRMNRRIGLARAGEELASGLRESKVLTYPPCSPFPRPAPSKIHAGADPTALKTRISLEVVLHGLVEPQIVLSQNLTAPRANH